MFACGALSTSPLPNFSTRRCAHPKGRRSPRVFKTSTLRCTQRSAGNRCCTSARCGARTHNDHRREGSPPCPIELAARFPTASIGLWNRSKARFPPEEQPAPRAAETEDAVRQVHNDPRPSGARIADDTVSRAQRVLSLLEVETRRRLQPLLRRFDVPSRTEVQRLSRRIGRLERCVGVLPAAAPVRRAATSEVVAPLTRPVLRHSVRCGACGCRLRSQELGSHSCDAVKDLDPEQRTALFWDEA